MLNRKSALILIISIFIISITLSLYCNKENGVSKNKSGKNEKLNDSISKTKSNKLILIDEDYKNNKVVKGAFWCLKKKFTYDFKMAYRLTVYDKNGKKHKKAVYPGGDIDPSIGVCTDVVVRAYRQAGIDLQKLLHEDAKKNMKIYPYKRWGSKPDTNIDHRRVPMLKVFLKRFGKSLSVNPDSNEWKPGDIVIWDMNNDGWGDHIGILSNIKKGDKYLVIHNFPNPGYVSNENVLDRWTIIGHYRYYPFEK